MSNAISTEEVIEGADKTTYEKTKEDFKKDLRDKAAASTEQADETVKAMASDAAEETCQKVDAFTKAEETHGPHPETLQELTTTFKKDLDDAVESLGAYVGKKATNAKENLEKHRDAIMERATNLVAAFQAIGDKLDEDREKLPTLVDEQTIALRRQLEEEHKLIRELKELTAPLNDEEIDKTLEMIVQNSKDVLKSFGDIYLLSNQEQAKIPKAAKNAVRYSMSAIKRLNRAIKARIRGLKSMLKAQKDVSVKAVRTVASKVRDNVKDLSKYLKEVYKKEKAIVLAAGKGGMEKGKNLALTMKNLRVGIAVFDKRQHEVIAGSLAKEAVKAMVKEGLSKDQIEKKMHDCQVAITKETKKALEAPSIAKELPAEKATPALGRA